MNSFVVRPSSVIVAGFTATSLLIGCGEDKRVKQLHEGAPRDSVLSILSQDLKPGTRADSMPNVYTTKRYRINARDLEILYFVPNDAKKTGKDTLPTKMLTPVVLVDNRLVGRGWDFWDSVSKANHIPLEKR